MQKEVKAVAFDVFGTLCDGAHNKAYIAVRDALGIDKQEFRVAAMTKDLSFTDLIASLVPGERLRQHSQLIVEAEAEIKNDLKRIFLYSDVAETLLMLQRAGIRYGLISNLGKPYAGPIIDLLGDQGILPEKNLCLWSFAEGLIKPDHKIYRLFCERVGVDPSELLVIGDREDNDLLAPREVGCQSRRIARSDRQAIEGETILSIRDVANLIGFKRFPRLEGPARKIEFSP